MHVQISPLSPILFTFPQLLRSAFGARALPPPSSAAAGGWRSGHPSPAARCRLHAPRPRALKSVCACPRWRGEQGSPIHGSSIVCVPGARSTALTARPNAAQLPRPGAPQRLTTTASQVSSAPAASGNGARRLEAGAVAGARRWRVCGGATPPSRHARVRVCV